MSEDILEQMLGELQRLADLPLSEATALPGEFYTNESWLALERERLFRGQWICAGLSAELPNTGDYLSCMVEEQPVVVIRQADGSVKAMSNVCRHRMMTVLGGNGNCRRLVCPYHAWSYDLDGSLIAAPHMGDHKKFNKSDLGLIPLRCEVWEGWIYVTLSSSVAPVKELLEHLTPLVSRYRMSAYVPIARSEQVWDTNWKQLTENFMEGYHLPVAHRGSVGGYFPVEKTRFAEESSDPAFTFQYFAKTPDAPVGVAHPDNTTLTGEERFTSILPTVFPSHMFSLAPDHFWYLSLQPQSTGKVKVLHGAALAPEVLAASDDRAELIRSTRSLLDRVNDEDRFVVEGIHRGARAPLSSPGPLCWLERENHEFVGYLARTLTGTG